ncbi:MAG: BTAD domain-containing putative transcriptional regulator, partial [Candidatus Limnocylindria bacterium]
MSTNRSDRASPERLPLALMLLGPPQVTVAGVSVAMDTRKATAMLAYLAVDGPTAARSTLAGLLWPEYDDEHARGALRRTLSTLRTALGSRWVAAAGDLIALDEDAARVDLVVARAGVRAVKTHDHPWLAGCRRCHRRLMSLSALHRGEFMAGFGLRDSPQWDDWQAERAGEVRREQAWILETLVELETDAGDHVAGLEHASRWLTIDPLHEPAHRALMRLRANRGDRSGAVRQYRDCAGLLDRELGVEPLPETTA